MAGMSLILSVSADLVLREQHSLPPDSFCTFFFPSYIMNSQSIDCLCNSSVVQNISSYTSICTNRNKLVQLLI